MVGDGDQPPDATEGDLHHDVLPGRTGYNPGGRTTPCAQSGANSEGLDAQATEGDAYCAPPGAGFSFEARRFHTGVWGGTEPCYHSGCDTWTRLQPKALRRVQDIGEIVLRRP